MAKTIALLLVALVIAFGGVLLVRYSEADDAPGGVVIGAVIVLSAVALAVRSLMRRAS